MHIMCIVIVAPLLAVLWLVVYFNRCRSTDKRFRLTDARMPGRRGEGLAEVVLLFGYVAAAAVALMPGFADGVQKHINLMGTTIIKITFGVIAIVCLWFFTKFRESKNKC